MAPAVMANSQLAHCRASGTDCGTTQASAGGFRAVIINSQGSQVGSGALKIFSYSVGPAFQIIAASEEVCETSFSSRKRLNSSRIFS